MSESRRIFSEDYQPTPYLIPDVELQVSLHDEGTVVTSRMTLTRREGVGEVDQLKFNGEELRCVQVKVDGQETSVDVLDDGIVLHGPLPERFTLETVVEIDPAKNLKLEGLYKSGGIFCTQMEAEGFRRFTYFLDRPDVLSVFRLKLEGDRSSCPLLLGNGHCVERGSAGPDRHFAIWEDPHPKPCYLFALVAGDLGVVEESYRTVSGREVDLRVYVDRGNESRGQHAMDSLVRAMQWDEEVFGLEVDLDLYMIVAVDAFNFGAMENKGLNIFNASVVLADPESATDADYQRIEGIVAHEYFHNWTGNRVTCRDWFQLTLKEGLTVFRDQEFSADTHHRSVFRLSDVKTLKETQFPEDSGPNAHPVKPASYIEINNFYTHTVYEKGAEVIRMIHTLIGPEAFRAGMDLYFERHDGQAVTTEDFVAAMADASGQNLDAFEASWYHQAGTPQVIWDGVWDEDAKTFTLQLQQVLPDQAGEDPKPYVIPIRFALLDGEGGNLPLGVEASGEAADEVIIPLGDLREDVVIEGVEKEPIPSVLRGCSAPVKLEHEWTLEELLGTWAAETDDFCRYEAGQRLMTRQIFEKLKGTPFDGRVLQTYRHLLLQPMDDAIKAKLMELPTLAALLEESPLYRPEVLHDARRELEKELADFCREELVMLHESCRRPDDQSMETSDMARRFLGNSALGLLSALDGEEVRTRLMEHFRSAANMTDTMGALWPLVELDGQECWEALAAFEERWSDDPVVMNKWFALQTAPTVEDLYERLEKLEQHPRYDGKNPNKVRSLVGGFSRNLVAFHHPDGRGYRWLAQRIKEVDAFNSGLAAGLARAFAKYPRLEQDRAESMKEAIEDVLSRTGLSGDVFEILNNTLQARGA